MEAETKQNIKNYSQDKFHQLCVDNGGKILLSVVIFLYSIAFIFGINIERATYVVLGLLVFSMFMNIMFKQFISEITLNFETSEIIFGRYRNKGNLRSKFINVKFKRFLGYLIFYIGTKKLIYNGKISEDLICSLSKLKEAASPNQ